MHARLLSMGAAALAWFALASAASPPALANDLASPRDISASDDARRLADWVLETGDNQGLPFLIVDKINAEALAFNRDGLLIAAAPVLLGIARGDDTPPGIGARALWEITPEDRITPAGRFVAGRGLNLGGHDILWIDYESALSLHPVITGARNERRLHRLTTTTAEDNRISYGCINVPTAFYHEIVRPLFNDTPGIVYILPETRPIEEVFSLARASELSLEAMRSDLHPEAP